MQTWTGGLEKGESVEIALHVFKSSVFGWLNREGLDGVLENRDEIPVGDPDADMNELRATVGAEKVARSFACLEYGDPEDYKPTHPTGNSCM